MAKAGFSYLMASVKYLRDGQYTVQRIEEDGARDAVSLTTVRIRPVMPGKTTPPGTGSTGTVTCALVPEVLMSAMNGMVRAVMAITTLRCCVARLNDYGRPA